MRYIIWNRTLLINNIKYNNLAKIYKIIKKLINNYYMKQNKQKILKLMKILINKIQSNKKRLNNKIN